MAIKNRKYPIPVHCELKGPKGKQSLYQKKEQKWIERSGSIYFLCDAPEQFHQFFLDHGLNRMTIAAAPIKKNYKEQDLSTFVKDYLKIASSLYGGFYFRRNHQALGNRKGISDWYFEMPDIRDE